MLRIEQVSKRFPNGFIALEDINLEISQGEIVSLVGTSGCGKSSLLRIIAGLSQATIGHVYVADELVTQPHPDVDLIFQEPRLMPWLTVRENVQFGLVNLSQAEKNRRTHFILERVGLTKFAEALPRQLSGGMAQRVAIARALITQPTILLLDEPFSALDAFIRMRLQDHLLDIWADDRPTLLLVTHDIEEALVLSDRVVVMRGHPGRIYQEFAIDLLRPRKRTDLHFQYWKEKILDSLNLSLEQKNMIEA